MLIDRQTMLLLPVGTRKPPTFQVSRAFSGYDGGAGVRCDACVREDGKMTCVNSVVTNENSIFDTIENKEVQRNERGY